MSISVSQSLLYSGLTKNMQFVVHLSLPLLGAHIATRVPAHRRGGDSEIGAFPWDPNRRRCLQVVSGRSAPNVADRYMQKPEGVADQSLSLSLFPEFYSFDRMLQETRSIQRLFSSLFNNKNMNFMKKKKTLSLSLTAHYSGRQLQFFHVDTRFLCLGRLRIIALSLLQSNKSIQIKSEPLIASSLRTRMNDVRHQGILGFDHQRCAVTAEADSPRSTAESP